jgi:holo-[acyl-carrier protein] synthase
VIFPNARERFEQLLSSVLRQKHHTYPCTARQGPARLRVGVDLVHVDAVAETLDSVHRERYLERIYTTAEVAACQTPTGIDPLKLAARFAAKEATMKMLAVGDKPVGWRNIELARDPYGAPMMILSGPAADYAERAALSQIAVSVSHDGEYAAAIVVGS